jgi:hypothetical protein
MEWIFLFVFQAGIDVLSNVSLTWVKTDLLKSRLEMELI